MNRRTAPWHVQHTPLRHSFGENVAPKTIPRFRDKISDAHALPHPPQQTAEETAIDTSLLSVRIVYIYSIAGEIELGVCATVVCGFRYIELAPRRGTPSTTAISAPPIVNIVYSSKGNSAPRHPPRNIPPQETPAYKIPHPLAVSHLLPTNKVPRVRLLTAVLPSL